MRGFTGTENYFPTIGSASLSDGAKYVADTCGAYWLMDDISIYQGLSTIRKEDMQVWKLVVIDSSAVLSCEDGNSNVVWTKNIHFTDFPYPEITLWCINNVIHLPSEY